MTTIAEDGDDEHSPIVDSEDSLDDEFNTSQGGITVLNFVTFPSNMKNIKYKIMISINHNNYHDS